MPLVKVRYDAKYLENVVEEALSKDHAPVDKVRLFGKVLQQIVSAALHAPPDGELRPDHIEVFFEELGPHDVTQAKVLIDIEAMNYPARAANRDERRVQIIDALHELFSDLFVSVWLKMVKASWGSDYEDSPSTADFDMSMSAAIERCLKPPEEE